MSKAIGDKGEEIAVHFLTQKGYKILVQNYRFKRSEIDIVALDKKIIVFIEVKLRKYSSHGFPETFVDDEKMLLYSAAAENYIISEEWDGEVRFDVIAITGTVSATTNDYSVRHFKDVFYPTD